MPPSVHTGRRATAALAPYLLAVGGVVAATLAAYAVPRVRHEVAYALLVPLVVFTAWLGGPGPGLVATVASALALASLVDGVARPIASEPLWRLAAVVAVGVAAVAAARRRHARVRTLREREERFRIMVDTAPVLVWMAGTDRRCVYVNNGWLEFTGRRVEQELGDGRLESVHPDDRGPYLDTYRAAFAGHRPFEVEYRLRRHDGEYRWVLERGTVRDADARFHGYMGSAIDVTERRRAVEELAARAEQQAAVAEMGQRALSTPDADALLRTAVELVARVLRVEVCTVLELEPHARTLVLRAGVGCRPGLVGSARVPAGRESQAGYTVLFGGPAITSNVATETRFAVSPFARVHGVVGSITVAIQGEQRPFGVLCAHTTRRRTFTAEDANFLQAVAHALASALARERSLRREQAARAQAEAANNAKDNFLATVSHELRTPLSPILAWARLLRQGDLDQAQRVRALEVIERSARVQAQLVDDLLDVSRIVSGKLRLQVRPVQLTPIVDAALETVRPAADAKGIRIHAQLDGPAVRVAGDADRLQQVVWNLLSNAVKFTPQGGRVDVRLERGPAHVAIAVTDTGRGVAPELLPRLFERFWQADSSGSRDHGGLGLGLAIVRHIVEQHGGTVRAESGGPGAGTRFTVELPLAPATGVPSPDAGRTAPAADGGRAGGMVRLDGVRVLLVDDEPDSNEVVATLLASCGADVRIAGSAAQALDVLRRWTPDVLVSDVAMPAEDGYALIGQVRALDGEVRRVPAVALTAHAGAEDRSRLLSAGFQMHTPKPVDPAALTAVVADAWHAGRRAGRRDAGVSGASEAPR